MPSLSTSPQVLGASLAVKDSASLAALDVTGMTLGTQAFNSGLGWSFTLVISGAGLSTDVVAVNGVSGARWVSSSLVNGGGFGSDVSVMLANSTPTDVLAMRMQLSLLDLTPGSEDAQWLIQLITAGVPATTALAMAGNSLGIPAGAGLVPSLYFLGDPTTGWISGGAGQWVYRSGGTLCARIDAALGLRTTMRLNPARGGALATGTTITMPSDSNIAHATGTTQVDFLTNTNWVDGAIVWITWDSAVTVRHNTGSPPANTSPFFLSGAANASYTAGTKCIYVLDQSAGAPGVWREWSRLA